MADAFSPILAIKLRGLTKSFGDYRALRGIDLDIEEGESVVIFGPNGAGKTTLIKVLATVMRPTSGTVLIKNHSLKDDAEEIRRHLGVVTHETFLYGNLTAYENLLFYSRMYDIKHCKERIEEVVNQVGMIPHLYKRVDMMSRGMQQRISIARSLLHKPSIMLMDEAETGLDQQSLAMLWDVMHGSSQTKRTVLLTTHNLERGLMLGDRIIILDKGKIAYQSAKQVLDLNGLKQAYQHCTGVKV